MIWEELNKRLRDYEDYYLMPTDRKRGQIWEKYDLNQLLVDIRSLEGMIRGEIEGGKK